MRNEELRNLLVCFTIQVKEVEMDGTYSTRGKVRNAYKILDGKPDRDSPQHSKNVGVDGRIILEWILGK